MCTGSPGPRYVACESWDDFTAKVTEKENRQIAVRLYRGHANREWKLASILKRRWDEFLQYHLLLASHHGKQVNSLLDIPQHLSALKERRAFCLHRFKELAIGVPGLKPADYGDDEAWWALGRHYGLFTPLLDWTYNPFVAAFFAFMDLVDQLNPGFTEGGRDLISRHGGSTAEYVAIWALNYSPEIDKLPELRIRTECSAGSQRQRAQQGVFSHLMSDEHLCLESYLASHKLTPMLECFYVPTNQYAKALYSLDLMNINHSTLFPDLEGAALRANISQSVSQFI